MTNLHQQATSYLFFLVTKQDYVSLCSCILSWDCISLSILLALLNDIIFCVPWGGVRNVEAQREQQTAVCEKRVISLWELMGASCVSGQGLGGMEVGRRGGESLSQSGSYECFGGVRVDVDRSTPAWAASLPGWDLDFLWGGMQLLHCVEQCFNSARIYLLPFIISAPSRHPAVIHFNLQ